MQKVPLSPQEIKHIETDLLRQVARFCDRNGLRYYLAYGTLLGAVRHQGFIPWDDDIDLLLPRPDYDRFLSLTRAQPVAQGVDVLEPERENYYFPFAKVVDGRTRAVERGSTMKLGVWIDVFPIDGIPAAQSAARWQLKTARLLRALIISGNCDFAEIGRSPKMAVKCAVKIGVCLVGRKRVARIAEKNARKWDYDRCEYVGGALWGYGMREKIRKAAMEPGIELTFEGERYAAPGCAEEILRNYYGEYTRLPPESQRATHGITAYYL